MIRNPGTDPQLGALDNDAFAAEFAAAAEGGGFVFNDVETAVLDLIEGDPEAGRDAESHRDPTEQEVRYKQAQRELLIRGVRNLGMAPSELFGGLEKLGFDGTILAEIQGLSGTDLASRVVAAVANRIPPEAFNTGIGFGLMAARILDSLTQPVDAAGAESAQVPLTAREISHANPESTEKDQVVLARFGVLMLQAAGFDVAIAPRPVQEPSEQKRITEQE